MQGAERHGTELQLLGRNEIVAFTSGEPALPNCDWHSREASANLCHVGALRGNCKTAYCNGEEAHSRKSRSVRQGVNGLP